VKPELRFAKPTTKLVNGRIGRIPWPNGWRAYRMARVMLDALDPRKVRA